MSWLRGMRTHSRRKNRKAAAEAPPPAVISVTLEEVKRAVLRFEEHLPEGINRTILAGPENEINFKLLLPVLGGIPDRKYYMSRESYEIFAEEDRHIPQWLDIVQQAVDRYMETEKSMPVVPDDWNRKISYPLLLNGYYLKERPPLDFYLTKHENLISHIPHR